MHLMNYFRGLWLPVIFAANVLCGSFEGAPSLELGGVETDENQILYKVRDVDISPEKHIYVLDSGNARIQVFEPTGQFIKSIGALGQGPGEFYEPTSLAFVGKSLWVVDYRNSRIQVFENDVYSRVIKPLKPSVSANIAVLGDSIFLSDFSVHDQKGGIALLRPSGDVINRISFGLKPFNDPSDIIWNIAELAALPDGRLLVGFRFYNAIAFVDKEGKNSSMVDMSSFYERHEEKQKDGSIAPAGFAVTAFAGGPDDSIFLALCNNEQRNCNLIYRFSADGKAILGKQVVKFHVWKMKYFPRENWLAFIDGEDRVRFYDVDQ